MNRESKKPQESRKSQTPRDSRNAGDKRISSGSCIWGELAALAESRKTADPQSSYTARLLHCDEDSLLKKLAEEAAEAALAAKGGDRKKLAAELADLVYHGIVVMARYNVSLKEVAAALRARRGVSGLAEKSARKRK